MSAEEFLERTEDSEIRILSSLVFSRAGRSPESVRKAESLADLKRMMASEIVHFTYVKNDGTLRRAYGTRDPAVIRPHCGEPARRGEADRPLRTFAYFDMVRDDWRAFRPESIVEIDSNYQI